MDVLVTGSRGLIGGALADALEGAGHHVVRLSRGGGASPGWDPDRGTIDADALDGIDAVVHLAGEGIGNRRWTAEQKRRILESRTRGTALLAEAFAELERKPRVLVSASAVGYYGDRDDEVLTEASAPGDDFLADTCVQWEAATRAASDAGIRVVRIRTGIVLAREGGTLPRLLTPFRLGLGGRLGTGRQYMSWISLADEVGAIVHALEHDELHGPLDLTAPNPVTNSEFTRTLGAVLHRPTVLPTPLAPLRLVYGAELVRCLLLAGQRVLPRRLEESGFAFAHPDLGVALRSVLDR